jgi:hypothetical protein
MKGYVYGDVEPKERCPYCGTFCHADFVDVGIGFTQCGPYHCENCKASEIGPELFENESNFTDQELKTGWYEPGSKPGPNANVDEDGKHIPYYIADTLYRQSRGVAPRYDDQGRMIPDD